MTKIGKIAALALSASVAFAVLPSSASAATYIDYSKLIGGDFGNDAIGKKTAFRDLFFFTINITRTFSSEILSEFTGNNDNVNFALQRVRLTDGSGCNGPRCTIKQYDVLDSGTTEHRAVVDPITIGAGTYAIEVGGSSQINGNYAGTFTLAGVPEPATWALTILGMGAVGFALRRRKPAALRVALG